MIDALPGVYERFLPELFQETIPSEGLTTCADCAMVCKSGDPELPGIRYYSPDTKCCTYHPYLPNFLVGGLLADGDLDADEGRHRIRQKIGERVGVTPMGISAPVEYSRWYVQFATGGFGVTRSKLCPYHDSPSGNCTVWKFRGAVCATYFCKPVAGTFGNTFWDRFRDYMIYVQDVLAAHVLEETNWDPAVLREWNERKQYSSETPVAPYESTWGDWSGREEEFFVRAYRIVSEINPAEFLALSGAKGQSLVKDVRAAKADMLQPVVPPILRRNPQVQVRKWQGQYVLSTDTGVHQSSPDVYEVLDLFDGHRTSAQIIRMVRETKAKRFPRELLLSLYQHRILIPA